MKRGIEFEVYVVMVYVNLVKGGCVNFFFLGLVINFKCVWLGCSFDCKVYDLDVVNSGKNFFGLLEVKVVKEGEIIFDNVRYLVKDFVISVYILKIIDIYYY